MAQLNATELRKQQYRVDTFLKKIREQSPFELKGGFCVIVPAKDIPDLINDGTIKEINKYVFYDNSGNSYKLSDFVKNEEFGGIQTSLAKEDIALSSLQKQIQLVKDLTKEDAIPIKIKNKIYEISAAISTPGTPKSDFHLVDINGIEKVWISHKDGLNPRGFRHYGGMSFKSEPKIYNHYETQSFIEGLKKTYPEGLPEATTISRKIEDPTLKNLSVYGNDFGGDYGRQNVTVILQGAVNIVKDKTKFALDANKMHYNGEVLSGEYEPAFMAQYLSSRNDFGLTSTRAIIAPARSRKVTQII